MTPKLSNYAYWMIILKDNKNLRTLGAIPSLSYLSSTKSFKRLLRHTPLNSFSMARNKYFIYFPFEFGQNVVGCHLRRYTLTYTDIFIYEYIIILSS